MRDHDRDRDFGRELGEESKGLGEQVKGKVKEETGDLIGDRSMEIEGKVEKNIGKARRGMANPTDSLSQDWDEDVSGQSDREDRDRSTGGDRSGGKDRSGY